MLMRCRLRTKSGADVRRQHRNDRHVGLRPQLTGETDRGIGAGADARQHEGLASGRPRQGAAVADDANAAGRAPRAAAADAGVRNFEAQAGFQDAHALRHADLPVRIGHREHAAAAFAQRAHAARREHQSDRGEISDRKIKQRDVVDDRALRRRHGLQILGAPLRLLGELDDLARAVMRADHRERRQQDRDGEQDRARPFEKRLQPQPEIEPDAGVRPRHRQQHELHRDHVRPWAPIGEQRRCIIGRIAVEHEAADAHNSEMTGEQQRNAQAQHELRDLGGRVAKMPPLVERPQAERQMRRSRGVEREIDDRNSPPPDVEPQPCFHGRVGDVAERMIEEMRKDVREHDEAAGDADLPHANAAQPCHHFGGAESSRAHVNDRRGL